jgi:hypothetical protein
MVLAETRQRQAAAAPRGCAGSPSVGSRWPAARSSSAADRESAVGRVVGPGRSSAAHHAPVPSQQRLECDHEDRPSGPGQEAAQGGKQRAVLGLEPRPWVLAAQDCQLVAEDQDLHLFGVC